MKKTVRVYETMSGKKPFKEWRESLRDVRVSVAVGRRIVRIEEGNFGDHKHLHSGVYELRIDFGPGFRIYYGLDGDTVVLLLCGGDKRTQVADIERAVTYWTEWKERHGDED